MKLDFIFAMNFMFCTCLAFFLIWYSGIDLLIRSPANAILVIIALLSAAALALMAEDLRG
jgi:hypothetical protein